MKQPGDMVKSFHFETLLPRPQVFQKIIWHFLNLIIIYYCNYKMQKFTKKGVIGKKHFKQAPGQCYKPHKLSIVDEDGIYRKTRRIFPWQLPTVKGSIQKLTVMLEQKYYHIGFICVAFYNYENNFRRYFLCVELLVMLAMKKLTIF